jgi:3-methylfumaryl-CoA hydratase
VSKVDIRELKTWIGRSESQRDYLSPSPAARLAATLDSECAELKTLPPLYHWLYFLPSCRHSALGLDGHPALGLFLLPLSLPRRMWAGSRLKFIRPMRIGEELIRTTSIVDVSLKEGRSGELVFVSLRHVFATCHEELVLEEFQDLVYRDHPRPNEETPGQIAPVMAACTRQIHPDPMLLFRYSALTFNTHRIHYDTPYATQVEGYPGLVVQAPLVATLLLQHLSEQIPVSRLVAFEFRAVRPLFANAPFTLCSTLEEDGRHFRLWSQNAAGELCTTAKAGIE